MADRNEVLLEGKVDKSPEIRYTTNGNAVASFTLHTVEQLDGRDVKGWHSIVVWGSEAENIAQKLQVGDRATVMGRISTRSWEKDGKKHYKTEVTAKTISRLEKAIAEHEPPETPEMPEDDIDSVPF